jgi:hypothetical protein
VSVDASDEQVAEIAVKLANESTFYCLLNLVHHGDGHEFVIGLIGGNAGVATPHPDE